MAKPHIVLIHGFRGTKEGLALIEAKLKKSFIPHTPDLPGFGNGPSLNRYDLDGYVTWLHDYIQDLPEKPILLGHSFGSIICAAYAQRYGNTVERLVLVNPIGAAALKGPRKVLTLGAVAYYKIGALLPEKAAHRWLAAPPIVRIMSATMAKTKDRELRAFIHDQHDTHFSRFHSPNSVLEAFNTSVSHSVADVATTIHVKTLLIAGDLDDITPIQVQRQLVSVFPDATLKEIRGVGHLTHYETPEEVADAIQAWISEA